MHFVHLFFFFKNQAIRSPIYGMWFIKTARVSKSLHVFIREGEKLSNILQITLEQIYSVMKKHTSFLKLEEETWLRKEVDVLPLQM